MPDVREMYSEDFKTFVEVSGLQDKLCGEFRPGHFKGVATVVTKLFNIVKPHVAFFGLKDYQQYVILNKMVKDLNFDIKIKPVETVRDKDGGSTFFKEFISFGRRKKNCWSHSEIFTFSKRFNTSR